MKNRENKREIEFILRATSSWTRALLPPAKEKEEEGKKQRQRKGRRKKREAGRKGKGREEGKGMKVEKGREEEKGRNSILMDNFPRILHLFSESPHQ